MSITKRKNGKYTAQIKDPETGQRLSLGTFDRLRDAQAAIEVASDALKHGEPLVAHTKGTIPFKKFVEDVFIESPLLRASPKTRTGYKTICKRLTDSEYFGSRPLNSIRQSDALRFNKDFEFTVDEKTGERIPRSANYRRKTAQILRQVFNVAVDEGYIAANAHPYKPELKANQLPARPKESLRVMLSHEAANQILGILLKMSQDPADEIDRMEADYWYHFLGCALHSGLRMSELCGLRVRDLDPKTKSIDVSRQWGWNINTADENTRFPHPKSRFSSRTIPMTDAAFASLWQWAMPMRQNETPHDLLFPRPNPQRRDTGSGWGLWGSPSDFSKKYKKALTRAWDQYVSESADKAWVKMPFAEEQMIVNIHQWRHCFCVICLAEAHVDVNTVSKWMGHHSAAFTYQTYSRYVPSALEDNLRRMDGAFAAEQQASIL